MIQIRVKRDRGDAVTNVYISGHADFADHGEDIVCSAVSGIAIGMVNAISRLLSVDLTRAIPKAGNLSLEVPQGLNPETAAKVQLLLEAMICSLQDIAQAYADYVQLQTEKR